MRTIPRLLAASAASLLGLGAALAGAGAAHAQGTVTFDSPSSFSMSRDAAGLIYLDYDNRSGRDLSCAITVSNNALISALDSYVRGADDPITAFTEVEDWPADLQELADRALEAGELNVGLSNVDAGHSGTMYIHDGTDFPMKTTFPLHGMSMCVDSDDPVEYVEFERGSGAGLSGSLGSLFGSAS